MKKIILALIIALSSYISYAQKEGETAQITFNETEHAFGDVKEGTLATYEFTFTNTGKGPLVLSNVKPSCGCTTPEWSKEPIMPGGKGTVKTSLNTYGRPGDFQKYITVTSNASNSEVTLIIKGKILPKPVEPISPVRNPMAD